MKVQKSVIFIKKKLKMNIKKIKNIVQLAIIVIIQGYNIKYGGSEI